MSDEYFGRWKYSGQVVRRGHDNLRILAVAPGYNHTRYLILREEGEWPEEKELLRALDAYELFGGSVRYLADGKELAIVKVSGSD